jgi:release factor glutamine methyltransferase
MNANSQPKTPAISAWLTSATAELRTVGSISSRLDAEIILAHTLRKSRTYLHAHDDELLTDRQLEIADARLLLRLDRTPIAYIIGHKEFYGRLFNVTPATLIPRPESEAIITFLKELDAVATTTQTRTLVDVGTGSGCLGITAKLELPDVDVTLIDISHHALAVARRNATRLQATVSLLQSDLLAQYPLVADYIVANLPYVDPTWECSPETAFEPRLALFSGDGGIRHIATLIQQLDSHLAPTGRLLLEADPRQHTAISRLAAQHGLVAMEPRGFILCFQHAS